MISSGPEKNVASFFSFPNVATVILFFITTLNGIFGVFLVKFDKFLRSPFQKIYFTEQNSGSCLEMPYKFADKICVHFVHIFKKYRNSSRNVLS